MNIKFEVINLVVLILKYLLAYVVVTLIKIIPPKRFQTLKADFQRTLHKVLIRLTLSKYVLKKHPLNAHILTIEIILILSLITIEIGLRHRKRTNPKITGPQGQ